MLLYGEKGKTLDFSETIVVYVLKLATDDQSDKKFLLTSKLCPLVAVYPLKKLIQRLHPDHMHISRPWQKHVQSFKKIGIKLYEEFRSQGIHCLFIEVKK